MAFIAKPQLRADFSRMLDADVQRDTYLTGRDAAAPNAAESFASLFGFARGGPARDSDMLGVLASPGDSVVRNGYSSPVFTAADWRNPATNRIPFAVNFDGMDTAGVGTMPSGWTLVGPPGGTRTIQSIQTINGLTSADFNFTGTTNATGGINISFLGSVQMPALVGETWTFSAYVQVLIDDPVMDTSPLRMTLSERGSGGVLHSGGGSDFITNRTTWQRVSMTRTLTNPNTRFLIARIDQATIPSGTTHNFTVRVALPVLERSPVASDVAPLRSGWLLEGAGTNTRFPSEDFSGGSFTKINSAVTAAQGIAPDGTNTATRIIDDVVNGGHYTTVMNPNHCTGSATHAVSLYVKADTRSVCALSCSATLNSTGISMTVRYDLIAGTATLTTGTPVGYGIEPVGNGWYRIWIAFTAVPAPASGNVNFSLIQGTLTNYIGDGSGLLIWGLQSELAIAPTSYMPTTVATTSRLADLLTIGGSMFTQLLGDGSQGALFVDVIVPPIPNAMMLHLDRDDGTNLNRLELRVGAGGATFVVVPTAGGSQGAAPGIAGVFGTLTRIGARWGGGSIRIARDGTIGPVQIPALPTGLTTLRVGHHPFLALPMNGRMRRLQLFKHLMSDAELTARSNLSNG